MTSVRVIRKFLHVELFRLIEGVKKGIWSFIFIKWSAALKDGSRCDWRRWNWCIIPSVWMSSCKRLHEWSVAATSSGHKTEMFNGERAIMPRQLSRRNATTHTIQNCHGGMPRRHNFELLGEAKGSTFKKKSYLKTFSSKAVERRLELIRR